MYKREIIVVKKLLAIVMCGALILSSGCGQSKGKDADASVKTEEGGKKASTEADAAGGEDTAKADSDDAAGEESDSKEEASEEDTASETTAELSEEELCTPIDFTFQNHPITLTNDGTEYCKANYYTFELDKSMQGKYTKLEEVLQTFGEDKKEEIINTVTSNTPEIQEMFSTGWGLEYEYDKILYPVRADGRVFSYYIVDYTYLAGAHGYQFFINYNYDPATGEELQFSDVVKNTDDLPEVVVSELEKQNEDIAKYFRDCPGDREDLLASFPERLENNARSLSWVIDYDGVLFNFEDYAMGSYAAGSQSVKVKFADYPDIFTDKYDNYKDKDVPDIAKIGRELKEDETLDIDAAPYLGSSTVNNATIGDGNDSAQGGDGSDSGDGEEDGYGEDWWYHAEVENPGWEYWAAEGIDTEVGKPSYDLSEVKSKSSEWLDASKWSAENGIALPNGLPYEDDTYSYTAVNNADAGEMYLTVYNHELSTLEGNFYFDDFINPPDQGTGMFAEFTTPYILYATVKDSILYVELGHITYASSNPHKAYIVAIDMVSGKTLWRSDDQVAGGNNFVILGDSIYCGYGFTAEPDFIYVLNRNNGKVQKKIKVKSAPDYFIVQEENMYVLTYNTEYLYKLVD